MKIVITGASGFVGSHLVRRLRKDGIEVSAIVRASTDTESLRAQGVDVFVYQDDGVALYDYYKKQAFDGCVHLAACFVKHHTTDQVGTLIDANLKFGAHCLEAAAKAGVPWFVNTGTFWQHYENHVYSPVNLYAATKQAFESLAGYYLETTTLQFVTLMLNDTYGPDDKRFKIMNLWDRHSRTQEVLVMSPGEQFIDIVYIDDVVEAYCQMIRLLDQGKGAAFRGRQFAVSSGNFITLKDLADLFSGIVKRPLKIDWGKRPYQAHEIMVPWNQGEPVPGWHARVGLEDGIRETFCKEGTT
ncbi:NAD(P)-dependent oxidoreductase [bacterium]|nr:NAD(P)-dependent oxidoreductase [bacterium]